MGVAKPSGHRMGSVLANLHSQAEKAQPRQATSAAATNDNGPVGAVFRDANWGGCGGG